MPTTRGTLDRYGTFLEALSPTALDRLDTIYTAEAHFRDPFSDVHGLKNLRIVFTKMYADVPDSKFKVVDTVVSGEGGYLKWIYTGTFRGRVLVVTGLSEVAVHDGRISSHIDYYDAASNFYERIPVLRWIVRLIKKRVGHAD